MPDKDVNLPNETGTTDIHFDRRVKSKQVLRDNTAQGPIEITPGGMNYRDSRWLDPVTPSRDIELPSERGKQRSIILKRMKGSS